MQLLSDILALEEAGQRNGILAPVKPASVCCFVAGDDGGGWRVVVWWLYWWWVVVMIVVLVGGVARAGGDSCGVSGDDGDVDDGGSGWC